MSYRLRPSSKKSTQEQDRSYTDLPVPKSFYNQVQLQNDPLSIRSLSSKLDQIQSSLYSSSEINRKDKEIFNASFIEIQKRLDMLQYKAFNNQKDIKQALDLKAISNYSRNNQSQDNTSIGRNDLNMLKQAIVQQRQSHKQFAGHQNAIIEQLQVKQMKMEAEIRQMINQQKNQYDFMLRGQSEQIRSLQHIKQRKLDQQYQMMKNVIAQAERKIYDELQKKIRNQSIMKQFIEDRIAQLREEIASQQKTVMTAETKFIRQAKQSIESLYSIIQNVKNELGEQLGETQKLSSTNIKRLSMSIDIVRDRINQRLDTMQSSQESIENDLVQLRAFVTEKLQQNRQTMIQLQQAQFDREDSHKNASQVSQTGEAPSGTVNDKLKAFEKQITQWKSITEQKNLNVFKQISNTLKSMRIEWKKENDEITSELFSLKQSVTTIKKSVPNQIKKSVQTIITIFNNQFDVLAEQLDLITQMVALAKKQQENVVKAEVKKMNTQIITEVKVLIDKKHKDSLLYSEKTVAKSQQQHLQKLEKQSKYILDIINQKQSNLQSQVNKIASSTKKNNLNTSAMLQEFTVKLKTFNQNYKDYLQEQRKDDMKKRLELQESMRKNANNLMDLTYKKCQFLVQGMKKAVQMNQMKDKIQLDQKVQILKDENNRNFMTTKNQFKIQIKEAIDKMQRDRQATQQTLHQVMQQTVNGNKKSLQIEMKNMKLEIIQKMNQDQQTLIERLNRDFGSDNQKLQEAVNSIRQSVWKLQAKNFSQQAKNKALFDRINQDVNQMNENMIRMANQLKQEQIKKG